MTADTEDSNDTNGSGGNSSESATTSSAGAAGNRVLVIGSTGSGKSTLINALVGYDAMGTSSDAMGCTCWYSTVRARHDDVTYEFIDTVGINEPEEGGTVSRSDALRMFFKFVKDNADGFNLIVFCTREGRMTEESKQTYDIMVKKLYAGSESRQTPPPVLIFVGGMFLDYEDPQAWCEKNRDTFVKQGFDEASVDRDAFHAIALPRSKNPMLETVFARARESSVRRAWSVIERTMAPAPVRLYTSVRGLLGLVQHVWNGIAANFGWPMIIPDVLRDIAKACGFTSREISESLNEETMVFV